MRNLNLKHIVVTLLCLGVSSLMAQEYYIDWSGEPKEILTSSGPSFVLNFEQASHAEEFGYLPGYSVKKSGKVDIATLEKTSYVPLQEWEKTFVQEKFLSTKPTIEYIYFTEHGQTVTGLTIIPLRINPTTGNAEKLVSFDVKTTLIEAKNQSPALKKASTSTKSVLAEGTVYKLKVSADGIYKINYDYLQDLGVDVENIDPANIHIYGNAGGMLPQANDVFRYDDLPENSITIIGGDDGSFDEGDYILFMGYGQTKWAYNENTQKFDHTYNVYASDNYYFLKIDDGSGNRINTISSSSGATQTLTTFDERKYFEEDKYNLLKSGRSWYGDKFDFDVSKNYSMSIPGLVNDSEIRVTSAIMVASTSSTYFNVFANGQFIGKHNNTCSSTPCATSQSYGRKGGENITTFNINASTLSNPSSLDFQYDFYKNGNNAAVAYLNYISVNYKRNLSLTGTGTAFRAVESTDAAITAFEIANAGNNTIVWDITNPIAPLQVSGTLNSSTYTFSVETDSLREFIAFNSNASFTSPTYVGQIDNQDIHGIATPPDLLIVTHTSFLNEAEELANFRRTNDNLSVVVLTTEEIYNEFSSGYQDVSAIRDCAKMFYDRGDGSNSLKYLLLFGDASYDYKNRISNNTNFVPVYESRESLDNIKTYSSDDYFGFLDDNEGQWEETSSGNHLLDIGVGRLPVKNTEEAQNVVDKLINYAENLETLGNWRNKIAFVADDGDNNLHIRDADKLAVKVEQNHSYFNIEKIYLDAYPQISSPAGQNSPLTNTAIEKAMENGVLVLNYTGHGGEVGWAEERILSLSKISETENINNLPIFVTATCEFGRYENPAVTSAAEVAILNKKGGAIGLLTTTRPVYAFSNYAINNALYDHMFTTSDSSFKRFGEVIRDTKNTSSALIGINNRNFSMLGDPSMALAIPQKRVSITEVNGNPVNSDPDTINALQTLTLSGEVQYINGGKIGDYNGTLDIIVYDKKSEITTLGNQNPTFNFETQNSFLYRGKASIENGSFTVSFVVPKDISYQYDYGKISLYAKQNDGLVDATGDYKNLVIGGSSSEIINDDTPPEINLFMDDESFVYAGTTGSSPLFIANLSDDNGINLATGGIGHDIVATLDGEEIIMNEFYTAEKDDYTKGQVLYKFNNLSGGKHTITLKAWDTHNNSSTKKLIFIVEPDNSIVITNAYNYPNPLDNSTSFVFDHNRAGEDLEVDITIYNTTGYAVKTIKKTYIDSESRISDIEWEADDDTGKKIPDGIYIYHLNVRSLSDGTSALKTQKLVIFK